MHLQGVGIVILFPWAAIAALFCPTDPGYPTYPHHSKQGSRNISCLRGYGSVVALAVSLRETDRESETAREGESNQTPTTQSPPFSGFHRCCPFFYP